MKVSPITVGEYYTNSAIDNALEKVNQAKGIFVPYAKKYGVTVDVDKAAKVVSPDLLTPSMQKLVDNNIVVSVRDKKTGKVGLSLVGATKDSFMHSEDKLVEVFDRNGIKLVSTKFNHEDNLLRTICRVVENLTKFVKR